MMGEAERRVSAIHQSLTQPILLAGAERPLATANCITAAALVFGGGLHWYTIAMGTFLLTVGHWALVQAAKFDPQLSRVYVRHGISRTTIPLAPQLLRRHHESGRPYRYQRRSARNGGEVGICFSKS
jgi:type IV secretion system protein TrbD